MTNEVKLKEIEAILEANPCHHCAGEGEEECVLCDIRTVVDGIQKPRDSNER